MFYMKIARDFWIWFKSIFAKLKYVEREKNMHQWL